MKPMSAEIAPRPGAVAGYGLMSLGFVAVGLWMLLAPDSGPPTRAGGLLNVAFFGLAAGLFALDLARPRTVLTLDREGVHLRVRGGRGGFDAPWSRVRSVRVARSGRRAPVWIETADPILDVEERPPSATTESRLVPPMLGVAAADVVAEIERVRRAYAPGAFPGGTP